MKKAVIFDMYGVLVHRHFIINEVADPEMIQVVREIKERGARLLLLSNIYIWNSEHFKKKFRFLELFDKLYFSSDIGLAKPDPRAYELVLTENNLKPEDCIFFDDNEKNVAAANALGIESYVFAGPQQVREKILGL